MLPSPTYIYPFYTRKLSSIQYKHHIQWYNVPHYTHQKTTTFQKVYTMSLLICLSVLSALVPLIISGLHIWRLCPVHIPQATTLWPLNFCLLGSMYLFASEGSHAERSCSYSTLKLDAALKGWLVQYQHCCIASIAVGYRFLLAKWFRETMPSICPLLLTWVSSNHLGLKTAETAKAYFCSHPSGNIATDLSAFLVYS